MKTGRDDVCLGCRRAVETVMTAVLLIGLYDVNLECRIPIAKD
jgi:hypothetical protein